MDSAGKRRQSARIANLQRSRTSNTSGEGPSTSGEGHEPDETPDENPPPVCPICRESTRQSDMTHLPCDHLFHQLCIDRWFLEDTRCPVCRKETEPDRNVSPPQDDRIITARLIRSRINLNSQGIGVRVRSNYPSMVRINDGEVDVWTPNSPRTETDDFSRRLYEASRRLAAVARGLYELAIRSTRTSRRNNEDNRTVHFGSTNGPFRMSPSMRGNDSASQEDGNLSISVNAGINIQIG